MKQKIIDELLATKIPGIEKLVEALITMGFFEAVCSGSHHLAVQGGLAEHSLNVLNLLLKLIESTGADISHNDAVIVALLHDVGKCGQFGKPNYVENVLKTGISKAKPYKTNPDLTYEEHEIRSVEIVGKYIDLTEEQHTAILHHNGLFGKLDSAYGNHNYDSTPLCFLLHTADMYCSRFLEGETDEEA